MNDQIDYKKLAQEIVAEQNKEFLSLNDICLLLGYAKESSTVRQIVSQSDFPISTRLVSGGTRKWFKKDVLQWIERRRTNRGKTALAS